jgi:restriction endonuclease S subunit
MKQKPYPDYKDSGVSIIGNIPKGWRIEPLKYNTYAKGRIGWQNLRSDEFIDEGPFLVTGMHFSKDQNIDWDSCFHISQDRFEVAPEIQLKLDDVLITKDGTIGKLAYIDYLPGPTTLNSHLLVLRPLNNSYIPKYLFYVLDSNIFEVYIKLNQSGTTFFGITQEAILNFPLIFPPYEEQKNIARFLVRETLKLDTLIAKQQHLIELLQEKRQAIISHAVTKGLNPDAKMKDSGVEWLGMVPEHWNVRRLKFNLGLLNEKTDRRDFSIGLENIEGWSGKFIKTETVFEGEGIAFKEGDILFGKLRPYLAKVYLAEFSGEAVGDFHVMRPRDSVVGRFAQYQMLNREFISIVDGSTFGAKMPRASWDFVGGMMVTTPPETEQESIATYLDNQTAKIDTLIEKAQQSIELAKEHRTALISAAVTGKIDVRNTSDNLETA